MNYIDIFVLLLIVSIIALGMRHTIRFLKGEECSCGSNGKKINKQLENIKDKKTFIISNMHCDGCKRKIQNIIISHPHLTTGKIKLSKKTLEILYAEEVSDEVIIKALAKAGYIAKRI